MLSRRSVAPFLSGAGTMLLLVIVLMWALPRWLPAGGLVIRVGPYSAAADRSGAPAAVPVPVPADAVAPRAAEVPPSSTIGPPPAAVAAQPDVPLATVPSALAPGRLMVPVQGVGASRLVDTYNQARGQGRVHDAIDIMAPRGTPVMAAADGVVLKLFQSARGGITLYELAPDRRTIYYYAHLDRYAAGIGEGRALRRGDVIGYVGDTGNSGTGNYHLHFEVSTTTDPKRYWAGTPQNPYPLLVGAER
ncbi:MAG TPA: M23 family metallopeptidase [Longimicrobium sp.]|nr:M23 family metallopeptidase [Longimicrobium sp.]